MSKTDWIKNYSKDNFSVNFFQIGIKNFKVGQFLLNIFLQMA